MLWQTKICLYAVFKEFELFEVSVIKTPSGVAD